MDQDTLSVHGLACHRRRFFVTFIPQSVSSRPILQSIENESGMIGRGLEEALGGWGG